MARGTKPGLSKRRDVRFTCMICEQYFFAPLLVNQDPDRAFGKIRECRKTKETVGPNNSACEEFLLLENKFTFCQKVGHAVTPEICAFRTLRVTQEKCQRCELGKALVEWMQSHDIPIRSLESVREKE